MGIWYINIPNMICIVEYFRLQYQGFGLGQDRYLTFSHRESAVPSASCLKTADLPLTARAP